MPVPLLARNVKLMSQLSGMNDDLRPRYDFTKLSVVARGPTRKQVAVNVDTVPDVVEMFSDSWGY